jgi:hypothetical protein
MVDQSNIQAILEELQKDVLNPEMIQDNKIYFFSEEDRYRVKMPTQQVLTSALDVKNRKYMELLQKKNNDGSSAYLLEKNLIKLLKESQNIDIEDLSKKINDLEQKMRDKYLSLAELHDTDTKRIEEYKKDLEDIRHERLLLIFEKCDYLAPSIQNQTQDEYMMYLTSVCTERCVINNDKEEWGKVWNTFDDYVKDDTVIRRLALGKLTELMINV